MKHSPIPYVRLTYSAPGGKRRSVWAREVTTTSTRMRTFRVVDREADQQNEMIFCALNDVLSVKPARVSLKYGFLETIRG